MKKQLEGRQLLASELSKEMISYIENSPKIKRKQAMIISRKHVKCQRCGHRHLKRDCEIEGGFYCTYCLSMGRIDSRQHLYYLPRSKKRIKKKVHCSWQGNLTDKQSNISKELLESFKHKQNHFVHAVTGAGKTEMLFPLIEEALKSGCHVGIATPRVDVCLELYPRISEAFPSIDVDLLYGHSKKEFSGSSLVICTTHQLMRFYRYFDVLVIDEVDAFPYVSSKELQFGAKYARCKEGMTVYLTATSNEALEKEVNTNKSLLARRFHGFDLPVPKTIYCKNLAKQLRDGDIPKPLKRYLEKCTQSVVIFFPDISLMNQTNDRLKELFHDKRVYAIHSQSDDREEVVSNMRQDKVDILLSTTILERGVTFKNISVVVVCAHHRVFNRASLIQIAGRVGRNKDYPTGDVLFLHEGQTRAIKEAIKEIKQMNKEKIK